MIKKVKNQMNSKKDAISLFEIRNKTIEAFEKGIFPLSNAQKEIKKRQFLIGYW